MCVCLSLSTSGFPLALYPSSGALLSYSLWLLWLAGWLARRGAKCLSDQIGVVWRGVARGIPDLSICYSFPFKHTFQKTL